MTDPRAEIDAATRVLREAEQRLRALVAESPTARRSDKVEVSAELRSAFADLRRARAALSDLEQPATLASLERARQALTNAEADLERALGGLEVLPREEKKWVDAAVSESLANLEAVRERLARVEVALVEREDGSGLVDGREPDSKGS